MLRVPARVRAVSGWLALAAATALFVRAYVVDYWGYDASDLAPIAVAGALVADGQAAHLYDHDASVFNELSSPAHVERHHRIGYASDPRPFVMPPLVAWLAQPIAHAPRAAGRALLVVNLAAVLAALVILDARLGIGLRTPWGAALTLVLLHQFEPLRASIELGQTTPLAFLAIVVAMVADLRDRPAASGLALALATLLKLSPALLALAYLVRGRGRALAWFAGASAAFALAGAVLVGFGATGAFAARIAELSGQSFPAFNNQSLAGFFLRFERPMTEVFTWHLFHVALAWRLVALGVLAALTTAALWAAGRAPAAAQGDLAWAYLVVAVLLVPSISWNHYDLYALVPAAVAWRRRAPGAAVATAALLVLGLGLMLRVFGLGSQLFIHGNLMMSGELLGVLAILGALAQSSVPREAA